MNVSSRVRLVAVVLFALVALAALSPSAHATHSWSNYHWARTSNPFTVKVIDSMTDAWDDNLAMANADWSTVRQNDAKNILDVLDAVDANEDDASQRTRKRCPAVSGKVRSCNAEYGRNGWLGLAQIWLSSGHIVQGTAKMNDSYLASSRYSEPNRQHVICQEIGHDWGLGHTSEDGSDQNTCMDYSRDLSNPSPNPHDYEQLETIYGGHTDSTTTIAALPADVANAELDTPAQWGREVHSAGRTSIFELEFPGGHKVVTHVFWAEERGHAHDHDH